ncbi:MAG: hypothetical protein KatS3mg001_077 [Candidatus Pacearchaeota archaeon]|nr:MAG: hypothetical protein KatS3mg001_077 [Candidatus Pacearchaeota archaeon]
MVKSLRRYLGKEIYLKVGEERYIGRVIKDYISGNELNGVRGRQGYFFVTNSGKKIKINQRSVRFEDGGLVLKLKKT